MGLKKVGELEIIGANNKFVFNLSIDKENKFLYFIGQNGTNEPSLCLSLDSLCSEEIKEMLFKSVEVT